MSRPKRLSKLPHDQHVQEYVSALRQSVRIRDIHGKRYRYIDRAAFWQQRCETLQTEAHSLRSKIEYLRGPGQDSKNLSELASIILGGRSPVQADSTGLKAKRGRAKTDHEGDRKSSKRLKTTPSPSKLEKDANDITCPGLGSDSVGDGENALVASMWELCCLSKSKKPGPLHSIHPLKRAVSAISSIISTLFSRLTSIDSNTSAAARRESPKKPRPPSELSSDIKSGFESTFRVVTRAYSLVLLCLAQLETVSPGQHSVGSITYDMVKMYESILNLLHQNARLRFHHPSKDRGRKAGRRTIMKDNWLQSVGSTFDQNIASFLAFAVTSLDPASAIHRELAEGYIFILCERVGPTLYLFTFNKSRAETIEEDIFSMGEASSDNLVARTALNEAPVLLSVLERAMSIAPHHLCRRLAEETTNLDLSSSPSKSSLSSWAKDRLQKTLVNAMFGPSEDGGIDFHDCLKLPDKISSAPPLPAPEERDISTWFTQKVWKLLGWEILQSQSDW
ncbi:MAG: hypothetical protein M1820_009621 [Bogoriella megaspora]|nr:MAG: hypothetical protein M1820_009621 [Bogoriella megaspora]